MSREIRLTQGKVAIVDDEDFRRLSCYNWYAHRAGNKWYAERKKNRKTVKMHHAILGISGGLEVDHQDGNGLRNTRDNLRLATKSQNAQNKKKPCGGTSRFKGVSWRESNKKWRAQIRANGHLIQLGDFDDEEDAAKTYDEAARRYFGEFARTNF
jgi:hypothetical protein